MASPLVTKGHGGSCGRTCLGALRTAATKVVPRSCSTIGTPTPGSTPARCGLEEYELELTCGTQYLVREGTDGDEKNEQNGKHAKGAPATAR